MLSYYSKFFDTSEVNSSFYCIPRKDTIHARADFAYIRWHGRGRKIWYDYKYSKEQLKKWVPKVKETEASAEIVYGYFNNHFRGNAIKDALIMKELLGLGGASEGIKDFLYE